MSSFAENIKALRKSRFLSQEKFAAMISSNQMTVSSWEVGTRRPNFDTIKRIAETFNVPVSSLIGLDESGNETDIDREMLDLLKSNPKLRTLVDTAKYLSNADMNLLLDLVGALAKVRV